MPDIVKEDGTVDQAAVEAMVDATYEKAQEANRPPEDITKTPVTGDDHSAGDDAVGDPADDDPAGDDTSAGDSADLKGEGEAWFSDLPEDMRELVDSLGFTEDDLSEISGPEELDRTARLIDKQLMAAGKRLTEQLKPSDLQEGVLETQDDAARKRAASERASEQTRKDGKFAKADDEEDGYKPQIDVDVYDQDIADEFERLNKYHEERFQRLEAQIQQRETSTIETQHRQLVATFDNIVDGLDEELFGKGDERTESQTNNRAALWTATGELMAGAIASGREVELSRAVIRRAFGSRFAEQSAKQQRRKLVKAARKQGETKLGSGSPRSSAETPWTGDPRKDPYLHRVYKEMTEESGAA